MTGSPPIRILTVDDHPVVREGIAGLVGVQPDMTVVAEAANGREAIQQFRAHRPDVTLMDIQMPEMNGLDALIAIRTEFPDARVIVLTTYEGDVHILRALKAGAQGYLLKNTLHSELLQTIRAVHAGKRSLSPEVSFQVAEHVSDQTLTPAEVVVLRLIAAGNANKQIADQLGITEDTVKGRVKSILAKLDANDRTHAAIIGLKRGIDRAVAVPRRVAVATDPKESHPPPRGVFQLAPPRRIIVSRYVLRRLYSTFAGGAPGIALLLMRLVVGAVVLWRAGPGLWSGPPLHIVASALLALAALLLIAGLWTPVAGAVVAVVAISEILTTGELLNGRLSSSNDCRRADDARARPIVDRRPALRMEAHRRASAQEVGRAWAEPGTPRPKGSFATRHRKPPLKSSDTIDRVVATHPTSRLDHALWAYECARTEVVAAACERRQSPQTQGGQ